MHTAGVIYAVLLMALPLVDFAIAHSSPYSILDVTASASQAQIDGAYEDLLQTLQDQNEKGLWSGEGDQELLAKKIAEIQNAHLTLTDSLERCFWHRDTGVRDWYGRPFLCWDEMVKDKLEALRDAIAQDDFSKLTWRPRSSRYSMLPAAKPDQEPAQVTDSSSTQEPLVTTTETPEHKTSKVDVVTEPAAKVTPEPITTKAADEVTRAWSTISAVLSYPVTVVIPQLGTWFAAAKPIVVSYSEMALAQAKTWLAILWAFVWLVATTVWSYLTTSFKLARKYLGPLAPSPSSESIPADAAPQPTIRSNAGFNAGIIRSLDGEQETVLTKLTSLAPIPDSTATVLLASTTNPLRYQSQFGSATARKVSTVTTKPSY
ncbi:uncharacterized protein PODANS_7_695 [Podospora anserina S mat+]|uniref:Podospora anserina S mat+ genomic DNA chromosome 7, supercontig 3 n=1 Tax=Podospora anserina (strain S / ATCC MYA-4624 / DSM 980 / FGSC 10383) TaxID=515849 RepID=B2AP34_PODAN|nr:uncharacterized protein PODANS_7_695 [Podospora anserina S mat+]CAP65728.1 unnamed protein product [Podospora anserina S mat+]CDP32788.1 Putative protein of unknown function [Podospora anserina S mat+]